MSVHSCLYARRFCLVLGVLVSQGCATELAREVGASSAALELECESAPAHAVGDVVSILSSIEPLDASQPQDYGSNDCAGVVFEFDNPDGEPLRGAWIQASGESSDDTDVLSESRCPERVLEADYWGYKKRKWSKLASASVSASFERGRTSESGYCRLDALIEHPGTFEKLRIAARVTQRSETYPMYACVW